VPVKSGTYARLGRARRGSARRGAAGLGEARKLFSTWQNGELNVNVKTNKATDLITRKVELAGITDIMFDRYPGDNSTQLEPHQKLYFEPGNTNRIGLPNTNIISFLSAHNTNSAPKRLRDKRKFKDIANAMLSFVSIRESFIPFLRAGKPIVFGKLDQDKDKLSGIYIHRSVARLDKGIPNPKVRPVLPVEWSLIFTLDIFPNREIKEQDILNLVEEGGRALGLGTFRGVFGKFRVESWN
jgi:hypothetical protein